MIQSVLKHKSHFWLLVALLVAFALRVHALGAQSLWNDEGNSVALAPLSLAAIANSAAHDIHPPLYYFLLHFWIPFVGNTEYAIRFLSVIAGVFTVSLVFRIAYSVFDERVAIIAAFFAAFSPYQIYYSQEARMYIWVTLFAAISFYAMARMLEVSSWRLEVGNQIEITTPISNLHPPISNLQSPPSNSRTRRSLFWVAYIAATIAALYTQYFAAAIVVAENIAFLVWLVLAWRDTRRVIASEAKQSPISNPSTPLRTSLQSPTSSSDLPRAARNDAIPHTIAFWLAAQAIIGLAIAPWYLSVREQLASWPAISESLDLPTLLWRVLNVFSVGTTLDAATALPIAIAFGILLFFGLRWTRDAQTRFAISTCTLWLIAPVGVMFAISLSRPAYNPKFLLLATPALYILAARGLAQFRIRNSQFAIRNSLLGSRITHGGLRFTFYVLLSGGLLLILSSSVLSLKNYYFSPAYARDDYRSILQFIDSNAHSGDGILVDDKGQIDVVRYYWRGSQQLFLLPRMRPPDPAATRADVDDMLGKVQRLFAVYYATEQSDPQAIVETRLAEKAFKARDEWRGNVRLAVYGIAPTSRGEPQPLDARVGSEIVLAGFQLDQRSARLGDVLTLTLYWRVDQTPSARYKVFVHLLDANNQVIAQRDGEPVGDTRATTTWRAGEKVNDNYGILLSADVPPGLYRIEIGMYQPDDGARLPISAPGGRSLGDHLILGTLSVK